MKQKSKSPINVPNIITITRILLTPFFVILLLKDLTFQALLVFTIAGISDGLDGFIARYFNQRTVLGAYLDPLADKLLLMSAFISLAVLKMIPSWLAVIVISRDVLIMLGIAILTLTEVKYEIKPRWSSKCTTVVQILTIILALLITDQPDYLILMNIIYWITAGFTLLSGFQYIYIGMDILKDSS